MIFQSAIWNNPPINEDHVQEYSLKFGVDPLIAQLLLERGIEEPQAVMNFLNPGLHQLHDPFLLEGMFEACERITAAIETHQNIWIYGDYDVDGITSIAILAHYFRWIGYRCQYYIPNRHDEGYGISTQGLDYIKEQGGHLVITVDCGITAVEQVNYARSIGLDVIITDHHEVQEILPQATAVINPKMGTYPFKMLAGCGVALKLTQALAKESFSAFSDQVLDIAALGTVADIVPLVDENRVITHLGLNRMRQTSNPGVQALLHEADLTGKEVNSGHIGFTIAPRINASGRIGNPSIAVDMLLETDYYRALDIAKTLSALNADRQAQEKQIMEESEAYIKHAIDLDEERILLVVGENWHTGIIGIVASKLSDKYDRPTVVLNIDGDMAKGSARSIQGISIYDVLSQFKALFEKFGGHEQAAGLSLKASNVPVLKEALKAYGKDHIPKYLLMSHERVSGRLKPHMITHRLVEAIEQLKPFGTGNPKPQFVFENLIIEDYKRIGKTGTHMKLIVNDGVRIYDALAFNKAEALECINKGDTIHLLLNMEKNHFMGVETIQFLIKDYTKDKMPLKRELALMVYEAMEAFLISENTWQHHSKFTSLDSFDIIFSVPTDKKLVIYSLEALYALRDYVLVHNYTHYHLHFGTINPFESRPGFVDVIFMPLEGLEDAYSVENAFGDSQIGHFVPTRDDLAFFYKHLNTLDTFDLIAFSEKLRMNAVKIKLCLRLLNDMSILKHRMSNGWVYLEWLPKPASKLALENVPLFNKIHEKLRR